MKTNHTIMIISMMAALGAALVMMEYLRGASGVRRKASGEEMGLPDALSLAPCAPDDIFHSSSARLQREIHALSRRGNLNLTIGVITTGFAVGLLAYMVMNEDAPAGDTAEVLSHYIPRISTVTFIEVFSYFFLRLYRASLNEIKYYQNELTVLAGQRVALEHSLDIDSPSLGRMLDRIVGRDPNAGTADSYKLSADSSSDPRLKLALEIVDRVATVAASSRK